MPVSGIVIQCADGCAVQVAKALDMQVGVEVRGVVKDNRIVAVIEADTVNDEVDLVSELSGMDGVITVHLAYHNFEDLEQ
jgi:nitrate reductase NapD